MTESCAEFPARHVFIKCPECRRVIDEARLHDNLEVCPRCGKHFRVSGRARMRMTVDEGRPRGCRAGAPHRSHGGTPGT